VVVEENNISKAMPWLTRILTLQANITGITDPQLARLAGEAKVKIHLKSLRAACDNLLTKLDALDTE
jgi:DNA-binding Xre family transcriptional regulator